PADARRTAIKSENRLIAPILLPSRFVAGLARHVVTASKSTYGQVPGTRVEEAGVARRVVPRVIRLTGIDDVFPEVRVAVETALLRAVTHVVVVTGDLPNSLERAPSPLRVAAVVAAANIRGRRRNPDVVVDR